MESVVGSEIRGAGFYRPSSTTCSGEGGELIMYILEVMELEEKIAPVIVSQGGQ